MSPRNSTRYLRQPSALPLRLIAALLMPAVLLVLGTLGYCVIEGWSFLDAVYMAVLTLTTVGFREVHELSTAGRIFTIGLALGGIFTFFYAATQVIASLVSGEMLAYLEKRQMEGNLAKLSGHLVVIGFGRMGHLICKEFSSKGLPFVVIDSRPDRLEGFKLAHGIPLHGDATDDQVLERAGTRRARALVSVASSDADNLYITMSARLLNESLYIVARADDEGSEPKMRRAGASRVVSPYAIGGARVAQAILQPTVVDYLDLATRTEHLELNIEETKIAAGSPLAGATLDNALGQGHRVIPVAIKKPSGEMLFNPRPDSPLWADDIIIILGRRPDLDQVVALASVVKKQVRP